VIYYRRRSIAINRFAIDE